MNIPETPAETVQMRSSETKTPHAVSLSVCVYRKKRRALDFAKCISMHSQTTLFKLHPDKLAGILFI